MANITFTGSSPASLVVSSVAGTPCDIRDPHQIPVPGTYDLMTYQRLASALYSHPPGHLEGLGADSLTPPSHPSLLPSQEQLRHGANLELKEGIGGLGSPWPYAMYYPYETLASYPFAHGYGMAFDASRRKNATRETTATLKAWLNEHKKNPYPTKGEKIMLAIITKMTLTQVSTWFANARRRLKKENKMTWEPRNKTDDDDDDDDYKDDSDTERRKDSLDQNDRRRDDRMELTGVTNGLMELASPDHSIGLPGGNSSSVTASSSSNSSSISASSSKPRIWCLAEMASSSSATSASPAVVSGSKFLHRPIHLETSPYGRPLQPLNHRLASQQEALLQVYAKSLGLPTAMGQGASPFPGFGGLNGMPAGLLPAAHALSSDHGMSSIHSAMQVAPMSLYATKSTTSRPLQTSSPSSSPLHILTGGGGPKITPASSLQSSPRSDG